MNEVRKHPDATQDLRIGWRDQLRSTETIVRSSWTAMGLTVVTDQVIAAGTVTVGWIAGGLERTRYMVTNAVMTNLGRQLTQTIILHIDNDAPLPENQL